MKIVFFILGLQLLLANSVSSMSGEKLYEENCKNCHGVKGEGIPLAIPPLLNSDFVKNKREPSIRAVLEGLSGKITVNGKDYHAIMPAVPLDDEFTARVLNFVRKDLNGLEPNVSASEVKAIRQKTKYPTYQEQVESILDIGLPQAPEGWQFKLAASLDFNPTRIIDAGNSQLLILAKFGDVHLLNMTSGDIHKVLNGKDYLSRGKDYVGVTKGIALDNKRRLYITNDYVDKSKALPYDIDRVSIYRTTALPIVFRTMPKPIRWYETEIPAGVGPYNHGISHIEQGPDGWMYVSFGSRTNAGETGDMTRRAKSREHKLSAAIWRLRDRQGRIPEFEVFAKGFRNPYSFSWDSKGRLFASENGPDKDIEAELNLVEQGKHYGFPYAFANLEENPHEESPVPVANLSFVKPLVNRGPDGLLPLSGKIKPLSTFTAHCVPVGMTYLAEGFPQAWQDTLLLCRFGGFWPVNGIETGFDILQLKYEGNNTITSRKFVSGLARPIDVTTLMYEGQATIVIAEYCRGRSIQEGLTHPGRILLLSRAE